MSDETEKNLEPRPADAADRSKADRSKNEPPYESVSTYQLCQTLQRRIHHR
jgi:hypothetical protein